MNNISFNLWAIGMLVAGVPLYAADPTFHLKNNSKDAIQIDIMQNGASKSGLRSVAKGGEFPFQLDISKPTTIDINYCPTADYCKTNLPDKLIAKIKAGKTVYVKFDGKKLIPQKGNKLTGKTTSGYGTENNVKGSGDIIVTEGKTTKQELGVDSRDPVEIAWKQFPEANKFRKAKNARLDYQKDTEKPAAIQLARLILDVQEGASTAEIKKAYIKLSRTYHPDKYTGDKAVGTEAFKIINEAQNILLSK